MNSKFRGFTLIELLVVIAIIGVLSSIVISSLNSARSKGDDASAKSNLVSARSQANLYYDANGASGYASICTNTTVKNVKSVYAQLVAAAQSEGMSSFSHNAAGSATITVCNDSATGWAAQVPLKSATSASWFCVDGLGFAGVVTVNRLSSATDFVCSS